MFRWSGVECNIWTGETEIYRFWVNGNKSLDQESFHAIMEQLLRDMHGTNLLVYSKLICSDRSRHAKKSNSNDKSEEKTLRFRFPVIDDSNNIVAPPVLHHYHFIAAVQDAFGDKIPFLDNNNRKV